MTGKKPTALKRLHNDRPDRINNEEPIPPDDAVEPPPGMSVEAREHWDRLAPSLIAQGVLTSWDVQGLAVGCEALARYWHATRMMHDQEAIIKGPTGMKVNPHLRVQREAEASFFAAAQRFGLTPADRTKIKTEAPRGGPGKQDPSRLIA